MTTDVEYINTPTNSEEQRAPGPSSLPPHSSLFAVLRARCGRLFGNANHHLIQTALWILVASVAAVGIYFKQGPARAVEFVTAYIVEYSLSIDNLFVFMVIFKYFKVDNEAQETALNWGVIGAMVLRGLMILLGKVLVDRFHWVTVFFALILLYSSIKLLFTDDDDDEDLDNNTIVKYTRKWLPVHDKYHGDRFFVADPNGPNGKMLATPLLLVLIVVEFSDVVFALDSVPAVLGLSNDTLVIYSSNILAVMGLRALFFVVSDAIQDLRFLQQALAIVLGFIGLKMIAAAVLHITIPVLISLGVVCGTLAFGILISVMFPKPEEDEEQGSEAGKEQDDDEADEEQGMESRPTEQLLF